MCSTYNFYELCGKTGATNKKILEELQGLGIEITRSELRERLARAVALGYMIRKARGHVFLSKICDRHVLSLLGASPQNNEENFNEKLMDDIDNDESAGSINRNVMTMTEVIKGTPDRVDSRSEIEQDKDGKNDKETVREDGSESENCFLKECWQQVGSFIEGLDKKSVKNRNCDGNSYSQSRVQQSTPLKPSTSKINETLSKAGSSRKSETNTRSSVGIVENVKEDILESGSNIEDKEIKKISASSNLINNKVSNKRTDQQQQDEGQKNATNCAKECVEDKNNSKLNVKETPIDPDSEND